MNESSNHSVYFVPGLSRGLRVLTILGDASQPMTLTEIAKELGVSRSSAFRLVYTLHQMAFLKEGDQKHTYTLGARVLNLGFAYLNQQPITSIARGHLSQLRDDVGVSAHLSALEGHDVLYLSSHQARSGFVSNLTTGTRTPAYGSGIGWCLLGVFDDAELEAFCREQDMPALTEHTPTDFEALKARVHQARDDGYVFSRGYLEAGGSSVSVPVRDNTGRITACVNISGPDSGFDFDRIESFYIPAVQEAALRISRELGYAG